MDAIIPLDAARPEGVPTVAVTATIVVLAPSGLITLSAWLACGKAVKRKVEVV